MSRYHQMLTIGLLLLASGGTVAQTPPNSLIVSETGQVGLGTATPVRQLHMKGSNAAFRMDRTLDSSAFILVRTNAAGTPLKTFVVGVNASETANTGEFVINDLGGQVSGGGARRLTIGNTGNIGLGGVLSPTRPLEHTNGAYLSAGGQWVNASSRELKEKIEALTAPEAREVLAGLTPVRYQYKAEAGKEHLGFIAEEVPEPVAMADRKGLNPMDIVAVLTKVSQEQQQLILEQQQVIQEQQRAIEQLNQRMTRLENPY